MSNIKVKVNGKLIDAQVTGQMRLLDFVRDKLSLTATRKAVPLVSAALVPLSWMETPFALV